MNKKGAIVILSSLVGLELLFGIQIAERLKDLETSLNRLEISITKLELEVEEKWAFRIF